MPTAFAEFENPGRSKSGSNMGTINFVTTEFIPLKSVISQNIENPDLFL